MPSEQNLASEAGIWPQAAPSLGSVPCNPCGEKDPQRGKEVRRLRRLSFSISSAACWKPGADASIYEKFPVAVHVIRDEVPPLPQRRLPTKRRLSSWCKAMLVCGELATGSAAGAVPTVFASKHGERMREVGMLMDYTRGEGVSQGGFSLSVHNVAASLFSISQENRQPYSAIAAGDETFEAGLLEAVMHLEKYERVLFVVGDEQVPKVLSVPSDSDTPPSDTPPFPEEASVPEVHAMLLTRGNDFAIESGGGAGALSAHDFFAFAASSEKELCGATIKVLVC